MFFFLFLDLNMLTRDGHDDSENKKSCTFVECKLKPQQLEAIAGAHLHQRLPPGPESELPSAGVHTYPGGRESTHEEKRGARRRWIRCGAARGGAPAGRQGRRVVGIGRLTFLSHVIKTSLKNSTAYLGLGLNCPKDSSRVFIATVHHQKKSKSDTN